MSQGLVYSMEGQDDDSGLRQPADERSLGVGLGVGILLITIFSMSCLVYWVSCRRGYSRALPLTPATTGTTTDVEQGLPVLQPEPIPGGLRAMHGESFSVVMPGDRMPKFVALPCPRKASSIDGPPEKEVDVLDQDVKLAHQKHNCIVLAT